MSNQVNRRSLLRGVALGSIGLAGAALIGCSDDEGDASTDATGTAGATEAAGTADATQVSDVPRGGTLRIGQVGDINLSVGVPYTFSPVSYMLMTTIWEPLVRYTSSTTPDMVLADSYEVNSDFTKVNIRLKPGLTFHNGAPVTPDDVFFGIRFLQDSSAFPTVTLNSQLINLAGWVTEMTAVDDLTMEFTLDRSRPNITDLFANLMVSHAASYEGLLNGSDLQGTGPFKWNADWRPEQSYSISANPDWHRSSEVGGPYLDGIEFTVFADQPAAALAFEANQIDVVREMSTTEARRFRDAGLIRIHRKAGVRVLGLNVENPILSDPRIREAIFYSIDRDRMHEEFGEGFGTKTSQPWPQSSPAFDPELEATFYDPDRSRALLAEAGYAGEPIPISLTASGAGEGPYWQEMLQNVGINAPLVQLEAAVYNANQRDQAHEALWFQRHGFSDFTPLTLFQMAIPYRYPNNTSNFASEKFAKVVETLENVDATSPEAMEQYRIFNHEIWIKEAFLVPSGTERVILDAVSNRVINWPADTEGYLITPLQGVESSLLGLKA